MNLSITSLLGTAMLVSELILARRWRSAGARGEDRGTLRMLWIVILGAVFSGYAVAGWGPRLPVGVPWPWVGAGVFGVGAALRWWSIRHLGRFFTVDVAVAADHRVVQDGPYRWVRHPSYSGLLLEFLGLALVPGALLPVPVMLVPITAALWWRIRVEEAALLGSLGESYAAYMRGTKRLVPGIL